MGGKKKEKAWVRSVECASCGEQYVHVELSMVADNPQGWPIEQPCPGCGRLGTIRELVS